MKVRALKKHPYKGHYRVAGSVYEIAKEKDVKLLMKLGLVIPVAEKPKAKKQAPAKKRTYKRRDMQAEAAPAEVVEAPAEDHPEPEPDIDEQAEK